ncbi:SRPBCC domain-containing protein [Pseudonocardia sp.]|uniref:SRPBCC domain-containing protein n=1 Tax=Pseudonocardia sp. TaxID=60912 RepID=UPI0031FBAC31
MTADAITRETRIAASQQRVWDVVTRAEHVGRWFGDAGAEIDLRPGGALRLSWTEHGTALGRVEQVSPIDLFSFRWARPLDTEPAPGNSTLVEFRLIPDGDGTRLIVTESGFSTLDDTPEGRARYRAGNEEGWRHEIGDLVEYIERVTA